MNELFTGIKKGFLEFGHNISGIVNTFLLSLVYFFGVGITSIVTKLFGKKYLEKKLEKKSYWSDFDLEKEEMKNYYRQF